MYIVRGLRNLPDRFHGPVVTIGNFDGVHLGHQAVFSTLRELAARDGAPTMAITFEPHPRQLVAPERAPKRIQGLRGKAREMSRCGIDALFLLRFDRALASLSPERFVDEILVSGLGAREVLVGFNFKFGAGGRGSFGLLQACGDRYGFGVHRQEAFRQGDSIVSSTRIREAVATGDFQRAKRFLGRPFEIESRVIHGHKRGRGLGFPTANLSLRERLHPPAGVYVMEAKTEAGWQPAVANLGRNPTFGDEGLHLEIHLLVPGGDLYGQMLRARFLKHLRPETAFSGPEELKAQIGRDVAAARSLFADLGRPVPES